MKFFSIFLDFYLFFPRDKLFLGFILNLENAEMWSPLVRPYRQASRAHWPSGVALPCCSTGGYNTPVSEAEAAAVLSKRPRVTDKELAALTATVSHDAAPLCRSCRAACRP
jgi:hypothetical protein